MPEEMATAGREPLATDEGAILQRLVIYANGFGKEHKVGLEERNDDVDDVLIEGWRACLPIIMSMVWRHDLNTGTP